MEKNNNSVEKPENPETGITVLWKLVFYFFLLPVAVVLALKWLLGF